MKYRILGSSGLMVSRITLGTMTFGSPDWGCDEGEAHRILARYLEQGGNAIDCADVYAGGKSEEIVGTFLPLINRENVVIASKCYFPSGQGPNHFGLSRKHLVASCEASLRRLRTDYIDLYYLHGPDPVTSLEETLRALEDLLRQGKIRYLGCSNLFGWQIAKIQGITARWNMQGLVAGQYIYSLIHRELEREIIPSAVDHGVGLVCYSPLGGGLLSGKYKAMTRPPEGTRLCFRAQVDGPRFWHAHGLQVADTVEAVSLRAGIPMTRLAIAWPLQRRFVSSVIIGARTVQQLEENLVPGDWDMPQDIWNLLEQQTRPEEEYHTWFNKRNYERFFGTAEFHDERKELP